MTRKELLIEMSSALYDYATLRTSANWDGKRPGLQFPIIYGIAHKSCGGFRAWMIHAHDGTVGFSCDGYRTRERPNGGTVYIKIGDGQFLFPLDDSRIEHCLDLKASSGSRLINVTDDAEIEWEPRVEAMAKAFRDAEKRLRSEIEFYDEQKRRERQNARDKDRELAKAALTNAE